MSRGRETAAVALGIAVGVSGVAMLLVLAQYDALFLAVGFGLVGAGLVPALRVAAPRRRARVALYATILSLAGGAWLVMRRIADQGVEPPLPIGGPTARDGGNAEADPLEAARRVVAEAFAVLDHTADYTFTVSKHERARGLLGGERLTASEVFVKIRREPFSVYARFLRPSSRAGTEAIYVEGRNDGRLIAHSTMPGTAILGTLRLEPTDWRAMIDQRHPITRSGLQGLAVVLDDLLGRRREVLGRSDVRWIPDATIDGRPCHGIEIRNDDPGNGLELAEGVFLFDRERKVPVHMRRVHHAVVDGVATRRLVEQYTVSGLVLDAGLSDRDFDPDNPEYGY